jgi:drug/metabolite transporter (DMT)-like permease
VGGQCVFNLLLKYLPATAVTMGILGEPVGTIILAFLIFGERIVLQQGLGMLCILGGLWIYFYGRQRLRDDRV